MFYCSVRRDFNYQAAYTLIARNSVICFKKYFQFIRLNFIMVKICAYLTSEAKSDEGPHHLVEARAS